MYKNSVTTLNRVNDSTLLSILLNKLCVCFMCMRCGLPLLLTSQTLSVEASSATILLLRQKSVIACFLLPRYVRACFYVEALSVTCSYFSAYILERGSFLSMQTIRNNKIQRRKRASLENRFRTNK